MATKTKAFSPIEGYVFWTPQLAVSELQRFHAHFGTASSEAVQKNYHKLYRAFDRNKEELGWFSDWGAFVKSANLEKGLLHTFWTKEDYVKVFRAYFKKHPDASVGDFEDANPDAYAAFRRHGEEWGLGSNLDLLVKLAFRMAKETPAPKPKPVPKPRVEKKPEEKPNAPAQRQALPKISVGGNVLDAEAELNMLSTTSGTVRWNLYLTKEVRHALLKFPEIAKKTKAMGKLRQD
jgi:hypothetical protein